MRYLAFVTIILGASIAFGADASSYYDPRLDRDKDNCINDNNHNGRQEICAGDTEVLETVIIVVGAIAAIWVIDQMFDTDAYSYSPVPVDDSVYKWKFSTEPDRGMLQIDVPFK